MVIVEYCKYGNLSNYLKSKRNLFCPNKVRKQMVLVGFILPDVSFGNVDVSSELVSSDSLLPKERNDFWMKYEVHLTYINIWCGMCCAKKGFTSPSLTVQGDCCD